MKIDMMAQRNKLLKTINYAKIRKRTRNVLRMDSLLKTEEEEEM